MTRFRYSLAAALCGGLLLAPALALGQGPDAPAADAQDHGPVVLPSSHHWTLRSARSGREYAIFVAVPDGAPPETGFPVIYVLDGNAMFLTTVEAARAYGRRRDGRDPRAIVVGVGYPDGVDVPTARAFDMTLDVHEPRSRHPNGGADDFLAFLVDELRPRIAREFATDPARQALMGHSFGGLFTMGALAARPDAFQAWIGMSASFWFAGHDMSRRVEDFARERQPASQATAPTRVLLTYGEFEERPRPGDWGHDPERASRTASDLAFRGQGVRAREAAEALARAPGMLVDVHAIPGEDHGTVIPAAIARGIDFILNGPTAVPPVPTGPEYFAMEPEGRYRLRMLVRALPDLHRIPWLNGLKAALSSGLDTSQREALHAERQEMDARHGSQPHARNAD